MSAEDYARWVLAPTLPERPTEPQSSYFVCGTPRSGSWLLCGLLAGTGIAGRPHEYFWRDTEEAARRAWGVTSFSDYLQSVLAAGTGANGVFGAKLMWAYVTDFVGKLRRLAGATSAGDRELFEQFFPRPRFVWVRRDDVVAQAVSWARAIQTGYWHHWDTAGPKAEPRFDFDQIDALVREAGAHDAEWRRWFAENRISPLELRFEDLVEDQAIMTRQVLAFLELDLSGDSLVAAQTVRSGDALNAEWAARYRGLKGV